MLVTPQNPPLWLPVIKLLFHLGVFLLLVAPLVLSRIEGPCPAPEDFSREDVPPLWRRHHLLLLALASPAGFLLFMIAESLFMVPGGGVTAVLLLLQAWRHRRRIQLTQPPPATD
jgi:hypothetical protein